MPFLVDPGSHHPAAEVEAVVRHVVLDVRLPRRDDVHRAVHAEVAVLGRVPLDVVDDLPALGHVERAPLELDHLGELRIVDRHDVHGLLGHEDPVEIRLGVGPGAAEADVHLVELAVDRAGDEGAVLLQLQVDVESGRLPVLHVDLDGIEEVGAIARPGSLRGDLHTARKAGFREQTLGLPDRVLVVLAALGTELIDGDGPLGEGGRDDRVRRPVTLREGVGVVHLLPIRGPGERAADPEVVERGLVDLQPLRPGHEPRVLRRLQARLALLGHLQVDPSHHLLILGAEVGPAGQERGEARRRVLVDEHLDTVGVGQAGHEVVRVSDEDHLDVRLPPLEHPGPGAHHRVDLLEVAELLDALLGDDPGRGRGQHVEEPAVRLLQDEPDRVLVEDLDPVHRLERRTVGVALDRQEPVIGVLDVVGGQLASVHRRLRMPADPLPQLEDVGRLVRLRPRLGQVRFDRVGHGLDRRARLHLEQAAVDERQRDHRHERDRLLGIEAGDRVADERESQDAAALRRLRLRRSGTKLGTGRGDEGDPARLEDVSTRQGSGGDSAPVHGRLLVVARVGFGLASRGRTRSSAGSADLDSTGTLMSTTSEMVFVRTTLRSRSANHAGSVAAQRAVSSVHSRSAPAAATRRPSCMAHRLSLPNSARHDQRRRVEKCSECS
jgi:hypothetical protein